MIWGSWMTAWLFFVAAVADLGGGSAAQQWSSDSPGLSGRYPELERISAKELSDPKSSYYSGGRPFVLVRRPHKATPPT